MLRVGVELARAWIWGCGACSGPRATGSGRFGASNGSCGLKPTDNRHPGPHNNSGQRKRRVPDADARRSWRQSSLTHTHGPHRIAANNSSIKAALAGLDRHMLLGDPVWKLSIGCPGLREKIRRAFLILIDPGFASINGSTDACRGHVQCRLEPARPPRTIAVVDPHPVEPRRLEAVPPRRSVTPQKIRIDSTTTQRFCFV